jgi:hypothetical protein
MRATTRRVILTVLVAAAVAVAPAAQAQEPLPFTIDTATLAADRHTVVVAGTYTCPELNLNVDGGGGTIDLTVTQGRVQGIGYVHLQGTVCDGTTRAWEADVTTFGARRFQRGPARVSASGGVTGDDPSGQRVQLRVEIDRQRITITGG